MVVSLVGGKHNTHVASFIAFSIGLSCAIMAQSVCGPLDVVLGPSPTEDQWIWIERVCP